MDVRLYAGDVYLDSAGRTAYLHGIDEAVQRVRIAAETEKGSFIYNRSLGTDYDALSDRTMLKEKLEMRFKEATAGIAGVDVSVMSCDILRRRAVVCVRYAGDTIITEVDLHGNI